MHISNKTKGLTDQEILEVCDIIGCGDTYKSTPNYCYFPASPDLCEDIHYEYLNGNVEFHIECEAKMLRGIIEKKGLIPKRGNAKNGYVLPNNKQDGKVIVRFRELVDVVNPIIEEYLTLIHSNYDKRADVYETEKQNKQGLYHNHQNFFEMLSNSRDNGSDSTISENEHTRILLAILKTGSKPLPVLTSFVQEFGIDANIDQANRQSIIFNKRYDDDNGSNFIDGLIYQQGKYAIIIENKICGAGDQPRQIERYIKSLKDKENVPLDNIWVIYLTKDGTLHDDGRPTSDSYNENAKDFDDFNIGDNLICINYHDDILPWLKEKVLPMIKYSEASMGWGTDCYIDYLEQIFQEDSVSRLLGKSVKKAIFDDLGIEGKTAIEQYNTLLENVKILTETNLYNEYRETLRNYMREIIDPIYAEFERATIDYFKLKGHKVTMNNKLSSGYIQIIGEGWDRHVHYEWYPKKKWTSFFFGTDDLPLCIHIEGKFKHKGDSMCESIKLEGTSIAERINNGNFETWLREQYDKVINKWDELEKIAT